MTAHSSCVIIIFLYYSLYIRMFAKSVGVSPKSSHFTTAWIQKCILIRVFISSPPSFACTRVCPIGKMEDCHLLAWNMWNRGRGVSIEIHDYYTVIHGTSFPPVGLDKSQEFFFSVDIKYWAEWKKPTIIIAILFIYFNTRIIKKKSS